MVAGCEQNEESKASIGLVSRRHEFCHFWAPLEGMYIVSRQHLSPHDYVMVCCAAALLVFSVLHIGSVLLLDSVNSITRCVFDAHDRGSTQDHWTKSRLLPLHHNYLSTTSTLCLNYVMLASDIMLLPQ